MYMYIFHISKSTTDFDNILKRYIFRFSRSTFIYGVNKENTNLVCQLRYMYLGFPWCFVNELRVTLY